VKQTVTELARQEYDRRRDACEKLSKESISRPQLSRCREQTPDCPSLFSGPETRDHRLDTDRVTRSTGQSAEPTPQPGPSLKPSPLPIVLHLMSTRSLRLQCLTFRRAKMPEHNQIQKMPPPSNHDRQRFSGDAQPRLRSQVLPGSKEICP
jgi:hypothetical protein